MPRLIHRTPKYRIHRPSGQARVTIDRRTTYLGPFNSPTSRAKYDELIAAWLRHGRRRPATPAADGAMTIDQLVDAYLKHAAEYYRRADGQPTSSQAVIRCAVAPLRALFGSTPAKDFGPLALQRLRAHVLADGAAGPWSRRTINQQVARIRAMFKWAAAQELVPASLTEALGTVAGLKRGRCAAREREPVRPVPPDHVDAVLAIAPADVGALIRIQRAAVMRPAEVCVMRRADLDMSSEPWLYRPAHHKTAYLGATRVIFLGPRARAALLDQLTLTTPPDAYIFGRGRDHRRPPSVVWYRRTIARLCARAGVEVFRPNQLRHLAATEIRAAHDIEAARVILGHSKVETSQIYAERNDAEARRIADELG